MLDGVGLDLDAIQRDLAQLHKLHLARQQQYLDKQVFKTLGTQLDVQPYSPALLPSFPVTVPAFMASSL